MTESQFIKENIEDWERLETLLSASDSNPEELQALFVKVSGDLSYARTYYPRRVVRQYLNSLLNQVFDSMRTRPKYKWGKRIIRFYEHTLPTVIIKHHRAFIISFAIFVAAMLIGVFSSFENEDFLRQVIGDNYVNMTEENIQNGDPMAVYKSANKSEMFLGITINNIQVAFFTFVLGVFASLGTVFMLIKNAVMLGAFQTFFYQKGLFMTSFLTIWIHGTIEISSIIIAGAAGIILGNGLLFPGTYSRGVSLRSAALEALVVLLSTVPLFVIAGFLEGFVTRHTELPNMVKVVIILLSLVFVLTIYVIQPLGYYREGQFRKNFLMIHGEAPISTSNIQSVVGRAFVAIRHHFGRLIVEVFLPSFFVFLFLSYWVLRVNKEQFSTWTITSFFDGKYLFTPLVFVVFVVFGMLLIMKIALVMNGKRSDWKHTIRQTVKYPLPSFFLSALLLLCLYFLPMSTVLLLLFVMPVSGLAVALKTLAEEERLSMRSFFELLRKSYTHWLGFQVRTLQVVFLLLVSIELLNTGVGGLFLEYFSWHEIFDNAEIQEIYFKVLLQFVFIFFIAVYAYANYVAQFTFSENMRYAFDLKERLKSFGVRKKKAV